MSSGALMLRRSRVRRRQWTAGASMFALLTLSACVSAPPGTLAPSPAADGLRVMTYNILGAQGDGRVIDEQAGWAARIAQLRPDVVVLQEAQGSDVAAIAGATGYVQAAYLQWACDVKPEPEGVAILVHPSIGVAAGGATHVGSTCADPTLRRVLVWADLELSSGVLRVYGTHLTAGGGAAALSRRGQIEAIRRVIAEDDPSDRRRWLLAGDINASPFSADREALLGSVGDTPPRRMIDTFAVAHPESVDPGECPSVRADDIAASAALFADPARAGRCGYTAGWAKDDNWIACELLSLCVSWQTREVTSVRERIDVVFAPEGGPIEVIDGFVPVRSDPDWATPGSAWFTLSDHLPLVTDLRIG